MAEMRGAKGESLVRVREILCGIVGLSCCRRRVGARRSVSFGFGTEIAHGDPRLPDAYYGEWEVGTYYSAWRIVQHGLVVCGSSDVVDSVHALNDRLAGIRLGEAVCLEMLSDFDIRLSLDDGTHIDFLGTLSEVDEHIVHFFGPGDLYLDYSIPAGWRVGTSAEPVS